MKSYTNRILMCIEFRSERSCGVISVMYLMHRYYILSHEKRHNVFYFMTHIISSCSLIKRKGVSSLQEVAELKDFDVTFRCIEGNISIPIREQKKRE